MNCDRHRRFSVVLYAKIGSVCTPFKVHVRETRVNDDQVEDCSAALLTPFQMRDDGRTERLRVGAFDDVSEHGPQYGKYLPQGGVSPQVTPTVTLPFTVVSAI